MITSNVVYIKKNNRIIFYKKGLDARALTFLGKYGLSFDRLSYIARTYKRETKNLLSYGIYDKRSNVTHIHKVCICQCEREYVFEIDLDRRIVKVYSTGQRAYKSFNFYDIAELKAA